MFSHGRKLIPVAVLVLFAGCGDTGITTPLSPDPTRLVLETTTAVSAETMVPLKWTYRAIATGTDLLYCRNSDGSPPWMAIPVDYTVTGRMSHLGRLDPAASSARFTDCVVNVVGGFPATAVGAALVELVGANGDGVSMAGELTLHFADNTASGEWSITGGSGRFEGAEGWMESLERPAPDGSASVGSGQGMITPPGVLLR